MQSSHIFNMTSVKVITANTLELKKYNLSNVLLLFGQLREKQLPFQ